jgi:Na+-driven multidrug efflux pump
VALFDVAPNTRLSDLSVMWIRMLGYSMPLAGWQISMAGLLQGAGATKVSLRINLLSTMLFQIPLCFVLGVLLGLGPFGVWLALPLSFVLRIWLTDRAYRAGAWAKLGVHA